MCVWWSRNIFASEDKYLLTCIRFAFRNSKIKSKWNRSMFGCIRWWQTIGIVSKIRSLASCFSLIVFFFFSFSPLLNWIYFRRNIHSAECRLQIANCTLIGSQIFQIKSLHLISNEDFDRVQLTQSNCEQKMHFHLTVCRFTIIHLSRCRRRQKNRRRKLNDFRDVRFKQ